MSLRLIKRGKIWHYVGTVAGRRLRGTTSTSNKKIAERIKAEVEAQAWQVRFDGPGAKLTFSQASLAYRDAGHCERFLEAIEDYWKDTLVREITGEGVRQMSRQLFPDHENATRNRQGIVPVQAVINYAAELGWSAKIEVKRFKENANTKKPVTKEWVDLFVRQAVSDGLPHLAALCVFMFGTAARRGEACALKWADVELFKKTAKINQTKTDAKRTAHLQAPVLAALHNIPSNRDPGDVVFQYASGASVGKVWSNVVDRAGIENLSPHCCRHGFATSMLQAGYDPKTVAVRGGWKDVATVMKYYVHAMEDPTVTDALFDTKSTRRRVRK